MNERLRQAIHTSNLLDKAREIIADPNVWCQGSLFDGGASAVSAPRVCAIGGVCKAANIRATDTTEALGTPGLASAFDRLATCLGSTAFDSIYHFNDSAGTTHKDVIELFDLAREEQCKIVREEAAKVPDADK